MAIMTRTLEGTGADVTILGYGAMELRGGPRGPEIADEDAGRLLNAVLDGGINLIDTSPDYGRSEELIGSCIGHRRDEFFLASKCGCPLEFPSDAPPPHPHDYSPENVRADVEQSLRRLRTDYLHLVQVHMSPSRATLEANRTGETLKDLQVEGKIRFIGMSGILPNLPDHIAMGVFDVFQIPYSLAEPEHGELISNAAAAGAGTVIRGGAAKGAWDGGELDDLLDGASKTEFILRLTLTHPDLHTTIVGTANPEHLADNVAAARKGPLPPDVYAEAKRRLAK
jgi:aryl-alcohol dehydrogenase-like predicted oxidoreductase